MRWVETIGRKALAHTDESSTSTVTTGAPLSVTKEGALSGLSGLVPNIQDRRREATMSRRRAALFALAIAFYGAFIARTSFVVLGQRWFVLFEDAMISMRYGRNLASGAGLVWNAGEAPVEGYTNFLWTLWMAAVHRLGLPESKVSLAIMLTGVVILIANALIVERIAEHVAPARHAKWVPFVATAAVLFYYPLVFWTLRGMEVGAVALAFDALILLALTMDDSFTPARAVSMGVIGALAILIRSDALVSVGVIGLYAAATTRGRGRQATILGSLAFFVGAAALGQLAFRRAEYGETLPNTYYLKLLHVPVAARLKRGVFVALRVLTFHLAVPLAALAAALAVWPREQGWWRQRDNHKVGLLLAVSLVQVAYAVYVGGDAWEWMLYSNRYMTVAMPAFIVLVTVAAARMADVVCEDLAAGRRGALAFAGTLVAAGLCLFALNAFAWRHPEQGIARTIFVSKSTVVGACAFVGLGALAFAARDRISRGLRRYFEALRSASQGRAVVVGLGLAALAWVPANLHPLLTWAAHNAAQFNDEEHYARLGILIRATTSRETRLAVVAAGATPYFSMRPSEDMLGKNDAHVAKLAPVGVFSPGHDKWDYRYTLGERRPDIMVERLDVTPDDERYIASLGYVNLPNGLYVKTSSQGIDRSVLGRSYDTEAELDDDLRQEEGLGRDAHGSASGTARR